MDSSLSPQSATRLVLWGALVLGLVLGAAGQASRFCIRGAIADWYLFGGRGRMLSWVLAVAVAALGSQLLVGLQLFDPARSVAWSERFAWPSYLAGGLLFGYGMVLAAGCPQRSLVKAGSGNLRAVVTLLVAAIAAPMTLRGILAEPRVRWLDAWGVELARPQDVGSMLAGSMPGLEAGTVRAAVLAGLALLAVAWLWRHRSELSRRQLAGSLLIGLLVPVAWLLTGHIGYLAEHPDTLEPAWLGTQSRRPEALSFTAPIAHVVDLLTFWSDSNTSASFGVVLVLGVLVGSFASARLRGEFRLESFASVQELRNHLVGGVLMGFGGVTAVGCSVGQGVTGLAMLSVGAFVAVAGICVGALLALRLHRSTLAPAR
jgi:uncharacterized protein